MKIFSKISACLLCLALLPAAASGAERLRERVYVATDRAVYVAGDAVWMSAWCVDAASGQLSGFSKTAYVEIHSAEGMVGTAKIALDGGRGAGRVQLPNTLPTGNYRLLAYTRLGASEEGFDALTGARTLSVVNTFSTERVPGGVEVVSHIPPAVPAPGAGGLQLAVAGTPSASGTARIVISNPGGERISFSLGIHHDDGIPDPPGGRIADFAGALRRLPPARAFDPAVVPEYEGEILTARVTGTDEAGRRAVQDKYAFISSPGGGENLYTEPIGTDGMASIFTTNIYGDQNIFLEIEDAGRDNVCHLELVSPFLDLPAGEIPPLRLSADFAPALELRNIGMQLERNFDADTLYEALPYRRHHFFDERRFKRYLLDDYTRFPMMEELFVEFITELRVRRVDGRRQLQVGVTDALGHITFPRGQSLVLLDGVPVVDHEKIIAYDPLLVRSVDIYRGNYSFGVRSFSGIVNFVTYKGTLPSMQFEDNVRIVEFQGCSYPLAYTCEGLGSDYPDYRQTLYWHPLLTIGPGETLEIDCKTPDYGGRFTVEAEGLDAAGGAVLARTVFDIP